MTRFFLLMLVLLIPCGAPGAAEEKYLEVVAPGGPAGIAIARPVPLEGGENPAAAEAAEVLRFDLELTGIFSADLETRRSAGGIREGDFDFAPWRAARTRFLVKSGYTGEGEKLVLEFRLFDVVQGKQLTAKRYTGTVRDIRRMAHGFSDEILREITGEAGPFTSKIAYVSTASGSKEIWLMDYDGRNEQQLTSNGSINLFPSFHPDGREILYTSYKKGNPDLFRRAVYSGAEARISGRKGINTTGVFAPSGGQIALTMSKDGNSEIYLIDAQGRELSRLTRNHAIDISPAWSPDGKKIAFVSDRLGKPQIFVMNSDGTDVRRLTTTGSYNVSPHWSPKGDRIAYSSQQGGEFQIRAIQADGSGDVQLTSEGSNEHPRWSPDGRFIAFSSRRHGMGDAVYLMRADGSGQTRVSRGKGNELQPAWSSRR